MSSTAAQHSTDWTVERYHQAVAAGELSPDDHYELIEGELLTVVPPHPSHRAITRTLHHALLRSLDSAKYALFSQDPIDFGPSSHPEPDVMVTKAGRYTTAHPSPIDVLLAIEVSDTTLSRDRTRKVPLYASHAIPELWIVDVAARAVEVYRDPQDDRYRDVTTHTSGPLSASHVEGVSVWPFDVLKAG